jgi:hypothetical protein
MIYGDTNSRVSARIDALGLNFFTPDINAIRQRANLYVYCLNNPVRYYDSIGLWVSMYVGVHKVVGDNYHTQIIIIADADSAHFTNVNMVDYPVDGVADGTYKYMTIGAGPSTAIWGKVTAGYNRDQDIKLNNKVEYITVFNQGKDINDGDVTRVITGANYFINNNNSNIAYRALPSNNSKSYNSNSFVTGLLQSSGLNSAKPSVSGPGWDKPIPAVNYSGPTGNVVNGYKEYRRADGSFIYI